MEQCGRQPAMWSARPMKWGSARPASSCGMIFLAMVCQLPEALPGKGRWEGDWEDSHLLLECVHLDSSSGFNRFQNMAIGRTSKLSSRTVLVGEGYSKFSQFPWNLHCLDYWACSPAPSSVLNAYLKLELLQATLHVVALPEPQPAPAGSTFLLFHLGSLVLL